MAKIETAAQLAAKCKEIALEHRTVYVLGAWGWPMTKAAQQRCMKEQYFNRDRKDELQYMDSSVFGFDCVGLIKGILWGWDGNHSEVYGGAGYACNSVPDINADQMIEVCNGVSADFSKIQEGCVVWSPGHIGVYIGDGLAVECTHRWEDGVQITYVENMGERPVYCGRKWTKHGKLPYVIYQTPEVPEIADFTLPMRVLRRSDRGEDVRALQILLAGNGCKGKMYETGYGSFGANTEEAVKLYQRKVGLPVTGVADRSTYLHLLGREGST